MTPEEIEQESFAIIAREAGEHGLNPAAWQIVRRMIHTSADFEYIQTVRFHPTAIDAGIAAIRSGSDIITDTNMLRAGIRKQALEDFGGRVICLINDPEVARSARQAGTTRAREAVNRAGERMNGGIYAVGNAPTALLRLLELVRQKQVRPALILGFPVGFVQAVESKDLLATTEVPHITNIGRKGGSTIAAAVVNALILQARQKQTTKEK